MLNTTTKTENAGGCPHLQNIFNCPPCCTTHNTPLWVQNSWQKIQLQRTWWVLKYFKSLLLIFIKCVFLRFPIYIYNSYIYINIHRYYILSALKWETLTFKRQRINRTVTANLLNVNVSHFKAVNILVRTSLHKIVLCCVLNPMR